MRPLDWLSQVVAARPATVLLAVLATVPFALALASSLTVEEDFGALLDENHPAVRDLETVAKSTGGTAFLVVAIDASHGDTSEAFADTLAEDLRRQPDVLGVEGESALDALADYRLLYVPADELEALVDKATEIVDERIAGATGLFVDLTDNDDQISLAELENDLESEVLGTGRLRGKDGKYLYLYVRLRGDSGDLALGQRAVDLTQSRIAALRKDDRFERIETALGGSVVVRAEEHRVMQEDLRRSSVVGFGLVVVLIAGATRRLRTLALVPVPLLIGVIWTFAFAALAWGRLNILTGFMAAVLFGLGIDFLLHTFVSANEQRAKGVDRPEATRIAVRKTGRAILTGAITTCAAFAAIAFAGFDGYRELGLLTAFGVLAMVVIALTAFPAAHQLFDHTFGDGNGNGRVRTGSPLPKWVERTVLALVPILAAFSIGAVATGHVRFSTNWRALKGESPASDFDDYIVESLGRSLTLTVVRMKPNEAKTFSEVVQAHVDDRKRRGLPTGVQRAISLADVIPADQDDRLEQIAELRRQLERVRPEMLADDERQSYERTLALTKVKRLTREGLPPSILARFSSVDGAHALAYLFTGYAFYEIDEMLSWADEMSALSGRLSAAGLDARIMSENWVAGTVFAVILGDGPRLFGLAVVFVLFVLWLDFRSLRDAALIFGALALGLVSMGGVMALLDLQLNFFNAVIVPCIAGIGIDGAVHVYHRHKDGTAVGEILRHTSFATGVASLTTIAGFGALALAHHKGIRSLGLLAIVGVATTYVSTSLFFPLALDRLGRRA